MGRSVRPSDSDDRSSKSTRATFARPPTRPSAAVQFESSRTRLGRNISLSLRSLRSGRNKSLRPHVSSQRRQSCEPMATDQMTITSVTPDGVHNSRLLLILLMSSARPIVCLAVRSMTGRARATCERQLIGRLRLRAERDRFIHMYLSHGRPSKLCSLSVRSVGSDRSGSIRTDRVSLSLGASSISVRSISDRLGSHSAARLSR